MSQATARLNRAFRLAILSLFVAVGLAHAAESPREWRRRGTDKTLEAVYVTVQDGKVVIARVSDGARAGVDFDDLSDADQAYVIGARQRELAATAAGTAAPNTAKAVEPTAAPTPQASSDDALSPSDAMDMANADDFDKPDAEGTMSDEEFDSFLEEHGLGDSSPIDINWVLVTILGVMNVPLYLLWGKLFFGDFSGFLTSLRFYFTPDIVSLFRGEYGQDRWEQTKMGFWVITCIVCVIAEYKLIDFAYAKIFA